jgi:hypothetical protein
VYVWWRVDIWLFYLNFRFCTVNEPLSHLKYLIFRKERVTETARTEFAKSKVKLSLCFNWAPRYEGVLGEWRCSFTRSETSALDEGVWSASLTGRFTPRERAPDTHWIGGWVGPRVGLDTVVKRKSPSPCRDSNPWLLKSSTIRRWCETINITKNTYIISRLLAGVAQSV